MARRIDLTGQEFGYLTVVGLDEQRCGAKGTFWWCRCICGQRVSADGGNLRRGNSQSCGCRRAEGSLRARFKDLTGQRFGRLVVLRLAARSPEARWECLCDCGQRTVTRGTTLRNGETRSCGCASVEALATHRANPTHGMSRGPTWRSWSNMRGRVFNLNHHAYDRYGGRGITICPEWASFAQFYADMGPRPAGMTLDRIDPDGNYEPGNCRWADWSTQRRNQRRMRTDGAA